MRIPYLLLSTCLLFSACNKDKTEQAGPGNVDSNTNANATIESITSGTYNGLLIFRYYGPNQGNNYSDTFTACKLDISFPGTDSMKAIVTNVQNNTSVIYLAPVTDRDSTNLQIKLLGSADMCSYNELHYYPSSDSVSYGNIDACGYGTNIYFYGKK